MLARRKKRHAAWPSNLFFIYCAVQRDKRNAVAKDVDYYNSKMEDLQSKGDKVRMLARVLFNCRLWEWILCYPLRCAVSKWDNSNLQNKVCVGYPMRVRAFE